MDVPPLGSAARPPSGPEPWAIYRVVYVVVAALLVLIAISVAFSLSLPLLQGHPPDWATGPSWDWVFGVILFVVGIALLFALVRLALWGFLGPRMHGPYHWRQYRRYYRRGLYGPPFDRLFPDPAVETARIRFARGEITEQQLEQILSRLAHPSPSPIPP